jgi:hypothetical protein
MQKKLVLLGTLLLAGMVASAQESPETPKAEVGLNYSYTRINPGGTFSGYNANGGFADVAYNFNRSFGFVADLGGSFSGTQDSTGGIRGSTPIFRLCSVGSDSRTDSILPQLTRALARARTTLLRRSAADSTSLSQIISPSDPSSWNT